MGFELRTEIEIAAPAERVWAILADFARYPSWNPFVVGIEGKLEAGAKLVVQLRMVGSRRTVAIKPYMTAVEAGKRFAWTGNFLTSILFQGEHSFEVVVLGPNRAKLLHGERFSGVLVPLFKPMLDGPTRKSFVALNEALKAHAQAAT